MCSEEAKEDGDDGKDEREDGREGRGRSARTLSLDLIDEVKRVINKVCVVIKDVALEVSSAGLVVLDIAVGSAVVILEINRLKPVDALKDDRLAGLAAGANGETILVATVEVLVASETLEGRVALWGDSRPAGLNAEVVVELVEEAAGRLVALGIVVPAVSGIGDKTGAKVETITDARGREFVAVLTTSVESDGESGVGSGNSGKEGGGEGSGVLGTGGNVNVTHEGVIVETSTAINLTGPGGLLGALVITDGDEDSISVDDLSAEADRLLSIGDSSVIVVGGVSIKRVDVVVVGEDVAVLRVLGEDEVVCDTGIISKLLLGSNNDVEGTRLPETRRKGDGARSVNRSARSIGASVSGLGAGENGDGGERAEGSVRSNGSDQRGSSSGEINEVERRSRRSRGVEGCETNGLLRENVKTSNVRGIDTEGTNELKDSSVG